MKSSTFWKIFFLNFCLEVVIYRRLQRNVQNIPRTPAPRPIKKSVSTLHFPMKRGDKLKGWTRKWAASGLTPFLDTSTASLFHVDRNGQSLAGGMAGASNVNWLSSHSSLAFPSLPAPSQGSEWLGLLGQEWGEVWMCFVWLSKAFLGFALYFSNTLSPYLSSREKLVHPFWIRASQFRMKWGR